MDTTTIKYCVPEETKVKLEIFDYTNCKVKTLVDEIKEPGTYQIEFYAYGLREGIYISFNCK